MYSIYLDLQIRSMWWSLIFLIGIGGSAAQLYAKSTLQRRHALNTIAKEIVPAPQERAPRPDGQLGALVTCGECSACDIDICEAVAEIKAEIDACCQEILATSCGPVVHIAQHDLPYTITQPGRYCVVEDLLFSATAISVQAIDVVIDFHNHSILLTSSQACACAVRDSNNVTILAGHIRAFDGVGEYGLYGADSHNISIAYMTYEGMQKGVYTKDCHGVYVESCLFTANSRALQFGKEGVSSEEEEERFFDAENSECVATRCVITNFTDKGVLVTKASNICLQDLILRGTTELAQHVVVENSVHGVLQGIKTEGLGSHGILISEAQNIVVQNCVVNMGQVNAQGIVVQAGLTTFIDGERTEVEVNKAKDCVLQNCVVSGFFDLGIYLRGTQKMVVEDCKVLGDGDVGLFITITLDTRIRTCAVELELGSSGIVVANSALLEVENCVIAIEAPAAGSNAIDLENSTSLLFKNCMINLNTSADQEQGGDGILLRGGVRSCLIQDCSIVNYPEAGIIALDSADFGPNYDLIIDHCDIHKALQDGICLEAADATCIKNCVVAYANGNGINCTGCRNVAILNNVVQNNGEIGIHLDDATLNCAVRDNSIFGNLLLGMQNAGGASNAIYHNFAHNNGLGAADNYNGVALVVAPAPGIGALENISQ